MHCTGGLLLRYTQATISALDGREDNPLACLFPTGDRPADFRDRPAHFAQNVP